jgi:hypothetical protein
MRFCSGKNAIVVVSVVTVGVQRKSCDNKNRGTKEKAQVARRVRGVPKKKVKGEKKKKKKQKEQKKEATKQKMM